MEFGTRIQGFGRNRLSFEKLVSGKTKKQQTKRLKKSLLGQILLKESLCFFGGRGRGPEPGAGGRGGNYRFRGRVSSHPPLKKYRGPLQHSLFRKKLQGAAFGGAPSSRTLRARPPWVCCFCISDCFGHIEMDSLNRTQCQGD